MKTVKKYFNVLVVIGLVIVSVSCRSRVLNNSDTKIFEGKFVTVKDLEYRATVATMENGDDGLLETGCTGTIIGSRHVVTAAHCVAFFEPVAIGFGSRPTQNKTYKITHVLYPQRFYSSKPMRTDDTYDVAIILVEKDFEEPLKPVQVLPSQPAIGSPLILAGYGFQDEDESDVKSLGVLKKIDNALVSEKSPWKPYGPTNFDVKTVNAATRGGDSGGPAYLQKGGELFLAGNLTSGGSGSPNKEFTQTYVATFDFVNWISFAFEKAGRPVNLPKNDAPSVNPETMTLVSIEDLPQFNKKTCEKWEGYSITTVKDTDRRPTCWPVTKKACELYSQESANFYHWDEKSQKCRRNS